MDEKRKEFLRTKVMPFHAAMCALLRIMAKNKTSPQPGQKPPILAQCAFDTEAYSIRFICRGKGIRPFLAIMDRPWPHKVYLGRLMRDGNVHLFEDGLKVFFNFLLQEEVLDVFIGDLEKAVIEMALAMRRRCPLKEEQEKASDGSCATCQSRQAPEIIH
jgi:hypothetical protein